MIHRKKNRPALQRRDVLTVSLVFLFIIIIIIIVIVIIIFTGNFLNSSSTQVLMVLFFLAFYTGPFPSKHFFCMAFS